MDSDLIYWLWLTIAFGPANSRKWNTLSHYASVKEAYESISSGNLKFVMPQDITSVKSAEMERAQKLAEYCKSKRINIYCFDDAEYPAGLKEIYNPPSVLFAVGDISVINDSVVLACVGTRTPSEYSVRVTERICSRLADTGVVIASGMAPGLDSIALKAGIKAGGKVVSVLPCGMFYDYPKNGAALKRAVSANGVVISEFFPDEASTGKNFHARNRILSGISMGTLVTQAGEKSGALSTASFASGQGRDVFCIPPHILYSDKYSGVTGLLRDVAIPVFDERDALNEYYSVYSHKLNQNSLVLRQKSKEGIFSESRKQPSRVSKPTRSVMEETSKQPQIKESDTDGMPSVNTSDSNGIHSVKVINTDGLSEEKKKIIEFVSENGAVHFEDIASLSDWTQDVETMLTELELEGYIKSLSGNRYTI